MEIVDKTHLLGSNPIDLSYGVTIQDFDGDGELEVFVATQGGANHLYKRIDGVFIDVAPEEVRDEGCSAIGVCAADMSGNGLPDVYVVNTGVFMGPITEPDRLYVNHGGFRFEDVMEPHPDRNIGAGRSAVWTDPLGTLRPGLYVCNYGAPNRLFVNGGGVGSFRNMAAVGHGLGVILGGRAAVSQDLFGKGSMDVFVLNENGPNLLYRNLGDGRFDEVAAEFGLDDPREHGRGLQACDLDRDGQMELLWANWEGPNRWMRRGSGGAFEDVAGDDWARQAKARTVVVADIDNDGWEEVFLNTMEEPNRLFRIVEDRLVEIDPGPLLLPDGAGTGASCGDLDGDGFLEIYISHGESMPQRNRLLGCSRNGHHWLRVLPLTPAGAPAIGARVRVLADRPMTRFVDGGSGYLCQMEPWAHFGLGLEQTVPPVEVWWPDGSFARFDTLEADVAHRIAHPTSAVV